MNGRFRVASKSKVIGMFSNIGNLLLQVSST